MVRGKKAAAPSMELNETEMGQLAYIVEQHDDNSFAWAAEDYARSLVDKGYAIVDITNATDSGDVPYSPTEAGIKMIKDNAVSDNVIEPNVAQFAIESDVPLPEVKRGGGGGRRGKRGSKYPFATMENGQSFFVPASEEMPNPAKTLASTASTVAKDFATPNGTRTITRKGEQKEVPAYTYTRKFVVRAVEEDGVKGARVWRHDASAE